LEKALHFLATTDERAAEIRGQLARKEYLCKVARAKVFLTNEGTVETRKAMAETSPEVMQAENELADAVMEHEKLKAKRATQELVVEVWRSLESSRRQGRV
jgi:hypothetical protein